MNEDCRTNPCMKIFRYHGWSTLMLAFQSRGISFGVIPVVQTHVPTTRELLFTKPTVVVVGYRGPADGNAEVPDVGEREMGYLEREIYRQAELNADEENDSTEIKRKKRMARTALTMWKESAEICQSMILQRKSEMRSIMNEVYQLVSLYSVFVGVVLTAVATSSRLECQHLWSPISLSLFAYFMVVVVAFTKFLEIRELGRVIQYENLHLRAKGFADFDFDKDCSISHRREHQIPLWRNALGLVVPLTIFTAGLVFSLVHILCWS